MRLSLRFDRKVTSLSNLSENPDRRETITKEDAEDIGLSATVNLSEEPEETEPQLFTAWLTVHAPVYDLQAPRWRFRFGNNVEYFDITRTSIAREAIKRGGALLNDTYQARIELVQTMTEGGKIGNHYSVVEVLRFVPAKLLEQGNLDFSPPQEGESSE